MNTIETDEQALRRAIILNPFDDGLRLIYADMMEDKGCDDLACQLRAMERHVHGAVADSVDYVARGLFVEEVHCPLAYFMEHCHAIAARNPIRKWVLTGMQPFFQRMLGGKSTYYWWQPDYFWWPDSTQPSAILDTWYVHWVPKQIVDLPSRIKSFGTEDTAYQWLQERCYEYARRNLEPVTG